MGYYINQLDAKFRLPAKGIPKALRAAKLAVKKATEPAPPATYRWDSLLKG